MIAVSSILFLAIGSGSAIFLILELRQNEEGSAQTYNDPSLLLVHHFARYVTATTLAASFLLLPFLALSALLVRIFNI